jgi:predicted nuclease of predicted toxin-antitoxin system
VKLLLDENLSPRLIVAISDIYPGSKHVEDCELLSAPDDEVWRFALQNEFAIVTKDSDFSEFSVLLGCPPKVIWLRIGNCTSGSVGVVLRNSSQQIGAFLSSKRDCCLVLSVPPARQAKRSEI